MEPTILTYFFVYLTFVGWSVAELWGSALAVATLAATKLNATIGTSAKRRKEQPAEMRDFRFIETFYRLDPASALKFQFITIGSEHLTLNIKPQNIQ